jgi:flagellar basal body L-ring protein FlgH
MKIILQMLMLTLFFSCSSYMDKMYRQLDRNEAQNNFKNGRGNADNFNFYRRRGRDARPVQNPQTLTSATSRTLSPIVKREYLPESKKKARFTANDFEDNADSGSIWMQPGSYLAYTEKKKKTGDIILINVKDALQKDIALELKKNFPDEKKKKADAPATTAKTDTPADPAKPAEDKSGENEQIHDKVSSIVVEEISKDHVLLKGRKYLLYKNQKRLIEIQALATRKDISVEDSIESDQLLETNVTILR